MLRRKAGPTASLGFDEEPPERYFFLNTLGGSIRCKGHGSPPPSLWWIHGADLNGSSPSWAGGAGGSAGMSTPSALSEVPGLRHTSADGSTLLFPAFGASDFRAHVHAASYRCVLSNALGKMASRAVRVRAAKRKQVYIFTASNLSLIASSTAVRKFALRQKFDVQLLRASFTSCARRIRVTVELVVSSAHAEASLCLLPPYGRLAAAKRRFRAKFPQTKQLYLTASRPWSRDGAVVRDSFPGECEATTAPCGTNITPPARTDCGACRKCSPSSNGVYKRIGKAGGVGGECSVNGPAVAAADGAEHPTPAESHPHRVWMRRLPGPLPRKRGRRDGCHALCGGRGTTLGSASHMRRLRPGERDPIIYRVVRSWREALRIRACLGKGARGDRRLVGCPR
ncbi:hypothetical protein HPB48_009506 [Haemaphysalis longicornis]|uniref:Ig-like domain-containing protein n=1 Tax=Haemaphysalis longicornis TaxID=44386 RepID=A0A9J6GD81_HAELO|nr:hypothetical protein HPB48_009506 [Haemaphysalis longicornis]